MRVQAKLVASWIWKGAGPRPGCIRADCLWNFSFRLRPRTSLTLTGIGVRCFCSAALTQVKLINGLLIRLPFSFLLILWARSSTRCSPTWFCRKLLFNNPCCVINVIANTFWTVDLLSSLFSSVCECVYYLVYYWPFFSFLTLQIRRLGNSNLNRVYLNFYHLWTDAARAVDAAIKTGRNVCLIDAYFWISFNETKKRRRNSSHPSTILI